MTNLHAYITHRLRGHGIAKGVDIASLVAELMGQALGSCKGSSMHIADVHQGMLGVNDIGTLAFFTKTYIEDNAQMLRALIASLPGQRAGQ